jgi:sortase A
MYRLLLAQNIDYHEDALEMKIANWTQRLLLVLGLLLVGIYVAAYFRGQIVSRTKLQRFESLRTRAGRETHEALLPKAGFKVDVSQWSKKRIAEYEESLAEGIDPPLAVLRISKVRLEVPVLEGTDDLTLNQGVGHIAGTVGPGEKGNIGIAGHRDGFFRVLKDIGPGDTIEVQTLRRTDRYTVDRVVLVRPNDVSVLQPRPIRALTLVTCYPFYFIGDAPQRFIVQASVAEADDTSDGKVKESSSEISEH